LDQLVEQVVAADLGTSRNLSVEEGRTLCGIFLAGFTRELSTNEATELQVGAAISQLKDFYSRRGLEANGAAFEQALRKTPPVLQQGCRDLLAIWPLGSRVLIELDNARDRPQVLQDWMESPPNWMAETPAGGLLWLAELADAYGLLTVSAGWIDQALSAGASPASYWQFRHALLTTDPTAEAQSAAFAPLRHKHVAAEAVMLFLEGDRPGAIALLEAWQDSHETRYERNTIRFLQCQFFLAGGQYDDARRVAEEALADGHWDAAQLYADRLVDRGSPRTSRTHFTQLEYAFSLSLRLRDYLRGWEGPSSVPALTAIKAAGMLGNRRQAWRLSQTEPEGLALASEAASPAIKAENLILTAETRPLSEAALLVDTAPESLAKLQSQAIIAERSDEPQAAVAAWSAAIKRAREPDDLVGIGFNLARHGVFAKELTSLGDDQAGLIDEIRAVARLHKDIPGQFEELRGAASSSRSVTFALVSYLRRQGELAQLARLAEAGGERWDDATLFLEAARAYFDEGLLDDSLRAARGAARVASPSWGGLLDTHLAIVQILTTLQLWSEAADVAAAAFAQFPEDDNACWALAICQLSLERREDAWQTFSSFGGRPSPRTEQQASALIRLVGEFDLATDSIKSIVRTMKEWPSSRQVKLAFAHTFLYNRRDLPDPFREQIASLMANLIAELDDVFVPHRFDSNDVRGSLDALVERLPDTSFLDRQVLEGTLPLGVAASIHHRSFAELLTTRSLPLFSDDPTVFEREVRAARDARVGDVTVDLTAVDTLGYFDAPIASVLRGYARSLHAPLKQRTDAAEAVRSLSAFSTMSVGRSRDGTAVVSAITDAEAKSRHSRASALLAQYEAMSIVERTWDSAVPELGEHLDDLVWAESVDLALSISSTLWCDDVNVRRIAADLGIKAFGTFALIEALRRDEVIHDDLACFLRARLISRGLVGSGFNRNDATAAAELESWKPSGAAAYLAWGPPDDDPEARLKFAEETLRRSTAEPDMMRDWSAAIATWLVRTGGDEHAGGNLVVFLRRVLSAPWLAPEQLPFIVDGIRLVTDSRNVSDPLEDALRSHYRDLSHSYEPRLAFAAVRGLVSAMPSADRGAATRVVFSSG
jgi:predicted nucleic acid-binding protein